MPIPVASDRLPVLGHTLTSQNDSTRTAGYPNARPSCRKGAFIPFGAGNRQRVGISSPDGNRDRTRDGLARWRLCRYREKRFG